MFACHFGNVYTKLTPLLYTMHKICQCGKIWLLSIYYHIPFRPCFALCLSLSACSLLCKYMLRSCIAHGIIDYIKIFNPVKLSILK